MQLSKKINELEAMLQYTDKINTNVSDGGIAWHLDHSLKVIISICNALEQSDPQSFKKSFNFTKQLIMMTGIIPRGKGRAPKITRPKENVAKEDILRHLEVAKKLLFTIGDLDANSHFRHPLFGDLNLKDAIKFMGIHTNHHLKIMRDIVA